MSAPLATTHRSIHRALICWTASAIAACCAMMAGVAAAQESPASAQWKPTKITEFVVPSGPGAALDIAARKLTELLTKNGYGQGFVVSNKSGAHSILALEELYQHSGDAHTLMTLSSSYANDIAQNALPANLQHGTPLVTLLRERMAVAVRSDSPIRDAQDLIAQLRTDPGKYSIGIATTVGNHIHLGVAQPLQQGGVDIRNLRIVPFKSSAESMSALVGGHLDIVTATTPNLLPYLQTGRVRILAIATDKRLDGLFAQSPTWKEQGIDYVSDSFQGVMTVPDASPAQQAYWVNALHKVSETPEWKEFLKQNQWEPYFLGPKDTANAIKIQVDRSRALLAELGLLSAQAGQR